MSSLWKGLASTALSRAQLYLHGYFNKKWLSLIGWDTRGQVIITIIKG